MLPCGHFKHYASQSLDPAAVCQGVLDPVPTEDGGYDIPEHYLVHRTPAQVAEMKQEMANVKDALLQPPEDVTEQVDALDSTMAKFE